MHKLISKYGLAAHLALVVVAPLFISPTAVLWLSALAALWLLMEPSRVGDELLHDARRRVAKSLRTDSVVWVLFAVMVLAGVRFANGGVGLVYDAELSTWSVASPKLEFLPGSVDGAGYPFFAGMVALVVAVAGCRNALGRSARYAFFLVASVLSAIGAFTLLIMAFYEVRYALDLLAVSFTKPVFLGSAFGVHLLGAIVALFATFERRWYRAMAFAVFAVAGNAMGLFVFAPPLVHCFCGAAAVVMFIYAFVYARFTLPNRGEFKYMVVFVISIVIAGLSTLGALAQNVVDARVAPYFTGEFITKGFLELWTLLSSISLDIWKANPWFGGGLGSFAIELGFHATKENWNVIPSLQSAPMCGYWLLLCERGVVGAFLVLVPVLMMLWFYVCRLVKGVRVKLPHPASWTGLLVGVAILGEAAFDASLFAPGVLTALASYISVSTNAFPKEK